MQTDHIYNGYSSVLREVIRNDDLITAEAFMSSLYPIMSDSDKDSLSGSTFMEVMSSGSIEMKLLFIKNFGLTQDAAQNYINSCLHDPVKDRSLLHKTCEYIGEFYGSELAGAFIMGDLEVAEALFKANKERKPVVSINVSETLIDGNRVSNRSEIMAPISAKALRRLTEIIHSAGLRSIIDDECRILGTNSLTKSKHSTRSQCFTGKIPTLNSGVIYNPGLLIAFSEQMKKTDFSRVFSKVPCWVRPGDFENSDAVSLFQIRHVMKQSEELTSLDKVIHSYDQGQERLHVKNGVIELKIEHTPYEVEDSGYRSGGKVKGGACNLVKEILQDDVLSGFNHPEGFQLAVVDVELLRQYSINQPSSSEIYRANEFAENFFPVSVLSNSYNHHTWEVINDGHLGMESFNGLEIFRAVRNLLLRDHILDLFPKEIWKDLYEKCSYKMGANEILDAKELFGFDDSVSKLTLGSSAIYALYESGFKFFNDGVNCEFDAAPDNGTDPDSKAYVYFIRMGGWPSELPKPESLQDGLTLAVRKKNDPIYKFYLLSVGAEEVVKAAKTAAQFNFIYEVFPREEITPLLKYMPQSLKGKHLEDDLGM